MFTLTQDTELRYFQYHYNTRETITERLHIVITLLEYHNLLVEPRSRDTRFQQTVLFVPTKSSYIFPKNNLLYTETGKYQQWTIFDLPSHKCSCIVNPALRTLVICTL